MPLVTVFGGSGGIGRQVVKLLAQRGDQVRVAVRNPQAALLLKPMGDVGQITPVQANIRNLESVKSAVAGADQVVNLVGILTESGPQQFSAVQTHGADNVATAAAAAGVQSLVHLSAIGASRTSPSAYARSKAAGEEAVLEAFPNASILRPSVVFGPHDQFFNRFAALAQIPMPLPVFGCGFPRDDNGRPKDIRRWRNAFFSLYTSVMWRKRLSPAWKTQRPTARRMSWADRRYIVFAN